MRPWLALYIGGIGAKEQNFHKLVFDRMGYVEVADKVQELYLEGRKDEAAALVPDELVEEVTIIGNAEEVRAGVQRWADAGVTMLILTLRTPREVHEVSRVVQGGIGLRPSVAQAAAPCPNRIKQQLIDWWGPLLIAYYAATEGGETLITSQEWLTNPGSVGRAWPNSEVTVFGDDGNGVPVHQPGQVYMRMGGSTFEYYNDKEKTKASRMKGYFTVGDIGYLDEDGYLFLCDRKSDMINSGGVNVYPAEIKAVVQPAEGVEQNGKLSKRKLRDPYWDGNRRPSDLVLIGYSRVRRMGAVLMSVASQSGWPETEAIVSAEENIATAKRAYAAFSAGDAATAMEAIDDQIEWIVPGNSTISGTYRGKEEVGGFWMKLAEKSFSTAPEHFLGDDERVVVLTSTTVDGESSDQADVLTFRDGKMVKFQSASDTALGERIWGVK